MLHLLLIRHHTMRAQLLLIGHTVITINSFSILIFFLTIVSFTSKQLQQSIPWSKSSTIHEHHCIFQDSPLQNDSLVILQLFPPIIPVVHQLAQIQTHPHQDVIFRKHKQKIVQLPRLIVLRDIVPGLSCASPPCQQLAITRAQKSHDWVDLHPASKIQQSNAVTRTSQPNPWRTPSSALVPCAQPEASMSKLTSLFLCHDLLHWHDSWKSWITISATSGFSLSLARFP